MHYFEITQLQFAAEIADYLPREAFNQSRYILLFIPTRNRTLLITEVEKLAELMDGFALQKQCRRITRRTASDLKRQCAENVTTLVGNIALWHDL